MRVYVDSSVFLKLFLDEPGADKAQEILEAIEEGRALGFISPLVLEEVSFKLTYAKASEVLDARNVWRIREALRLDEKVREECLKLLKAFRKYVEHMLTKGLRVAYATYDDWCRALCLVERYGLLPADAMHVAIALRVGARTIATFDEDFRVVKEIRVAP